MKKHQYQYLISMVVGAGLFSVHTSCIALQNYPLVDQQSTKVIISQKEQNRIAVLGDRIQQVFGADGTFDVESDEDGGQIFLIAAKSGFSQFDAPSVIKPMTITIITEEGLTQDLKLIPKDIEAQSILFKPTLTIAEEPKENHNHLKQVIQLLKAMVKNEELEGYTKIPLEKDPPSLPIRTTPFTSIKVKEITTYKGKQYTGKIYTLFNQGKETLSIKESDFVSHQDMSPQDIALSLSKPVIHGHETITLYVVTREWPTPECATRECARRGL